MTTPCHLVSKEVTYIHMYFKFIILTLCFHRNTILSVQSPVTNQIKIVRIFVSSITRVASVMVGYVVGQSSTMMFCCSLRWNRMPSGKDGY